MPKKYYAVRVGRRPGIYESWKDCSEQVSRYSRSDYKGFPTLQEAEAYMSAAPPQPAMESAQPRCPPRQPRRELVPDSDGLVTFASEEDMFSYLLGVEVTRSPNGELTLAKSR